MDGKDVADVGRRGRRRRRPSSGVALQPPGAPRSAAASSPPARSARCSLSSVGGGDGGDGGRQRRRDRRRPAAGSGRAPPSVDILNWTEYIDPTEDGDVGTVDRFQDETGISVNYSETFNDNNEVYGKEFAAYLDAGNPTPWDIAMPTYWMAARLKSKGWLAPLPFNLIPNYVNLDPQYLNLAWDPGRQVPPAVAGRVSPASPTTRRSPAAS